MFRKTVAMIVMIAFMTVLGVTTYPLHAQTQPDSSTAKAQDKPGAVERTGDSSGAPRATASSALPIILILVGVGALAAILFLVILKSSYDITGTWYFVKNNTAYEVTMTFSGSKESGTALYDNDMPGVYSVTSNNVSITVSKRYPNTNSDAYFFTGQFTDKDTMSGTFHTEHITQTGTWTATRTSAAAALKSRQHKQ